MIKYILLFSGLNLYNTASLYGNHSPRHGNLCAMFFPSMQENMAETNWKSKVNNYWLQISQWKGCRETRLHNIWHYKATKEGQAKEEITHNTKDLIGTVLH